MNGRAGACLGALLALAGCAGAAPPPRWSPRAHAIPVFLVAEGWHTGIALPADDLGPALAPLRRDFPAVSLLLIGFGARNYMEAAHPGSADALHAIVPGPGALLVTGISGPPQAAFGASDVVVLRLGAGGLARMEDFVAASLARTASGAPAFLAATPYGRLYATRIDYALDDTCNTWAIAALAAGGVPVSPAGVVTAGDAMAKARAAAASEPAASPLSAGRSAPGDSAPPARPAP